MLEIRTPGSRIVGKDESTELHRASTWFGIIFAIVDMLHLVDIYKMLNGATNRKN